MSGERERAVALLGELELERPVLKRRIATNEARLKALKRSLSSRYLQLDVLDKRIADLTHVLGDSAADQSLEKGKNGLLAYVQQHPNGVALKLAREKFGPSVDTIASRLVKDNAITKTRIHPRGVVLRAN